MTKTSDLPGFVRIGAFELDVRAGELRRDGRRIRLQEQPARILAALLLRPGEIVTREELRQELWPGDTFVDFEHGLNTAVKKLRQALGDDANSPRYIETIPRRGYRLIAPVERADGATRAPRFTPSKSFRYLALGCTLAVLIAGVALIPWGGEPTRVRPEWTRLTSFPASATSPALSRDGRLLAFIRGPGTFYTAGEIYVMSLPDGEPVQLTNDGTFKMSPAFSPDGTRIAYTTVDSRTHAWDTWVVPVLGGQPHLLLRNASGLTWVGERQILFSEIDKGLHMSIMTATESRAGSRSVYVPPPRPGAMAHRSDLSPDGKWVLVAEMDDEWLPCRVVPFDGSSKGRQVGPRTEACTSAAWSPDGKWMYFSSDASGSFHLWRQRFPEGQPEQISFSSTEEEGIAVAPDGRSLITSVGIQQRAVWIHEAGADRRVSAEGYAFLPRFGPAALGGCFSPDGKRLHYLVKRDPSGPQDAGDLRAAHLDSGRSVQLLAGFRVTAFDVSRDEDRVVFSALDESAKPRLWLASLSSRFAPRRLTIIDTYSPRFASSGQIVFRGGGGALSFIYRISEDGGTPQRVTPDPISTIHSVSPDGQWIVVHLAEEDQPSRVAAYPLAGGPPKNICSAWCAVQWGPTGRFLYITLEGSSHDKGWKTFVIPVSADKAIPELPPGGIRSEADLSRLPIAHVVTRRYIAPGPEPSTYAFNEGTVNRNLYRIPIP